MKYRRKRPSQERAELEKLKSQLLADDAFKDQRIVFRAGQEKQSEVLLQFIEPYLKQATTPQTYKSLIGLAVLAWNVALFDEAERQNVLNLAKEELLATASEEIKNDLANLLTELVQRKQRYFADNKRLIVSYHLSPAKEGYHLSVASLE